MTTPAISDRPATAVAPATIPVPVPIATTAVPAAAVWWLALIVVVTVAGFQRTLARGPAALDLAHAVHGTAALGWSLLLVAQAWLAEHRRRSWHRQLAVAGVICAIALVTSSVPMLRALAQGATASARFRPIGHRLFVMDVLLLVLFVLLFALAMANVRRPAMHARAMAATGFLALPAGLGRGYMRLFGVDPAVGSYLALATGVAMLGALIVQDRRRGVRDLVLPGTMAALVAIGVLSATVADAAWVSAMVRSAG